jgi:hypothetical protein
MTKLPNELLNLIFIYLPLVQKQECMLVSKLWKELIWTGDLFNSIHISSPGVFKKFIHLIKQQPELGLQVKNLVLLRCIDFTFDREKLLLLFPNAKKIKISRAPGTPNAVPIENQSSLTSCVNDQVENLEDFNDFELTRSFMTHNSFQNLKTLKLNGQAATATDILSSLTNMPVLNSLTLDWFKLTMDMCETMHNNIPSLESLVATHTNLLPTRRPENVVPNLSLTTLEISAVAYPRISGNADWFNYFPRKYSHLKRFKFDLYELFEPQDWGTVYQAQMPLLLQNCGSNLTSLFLSCSLDPDLQVLKGIDARGHHLKELEIDAFNEIDGYTVLAELDLSKHIERLSLLKVHPQCNLEKLNDLDRLVSLKLRFISPRESYTGNILDREAYEIHFAENRIDIVELFSHFPESLESVDIMCVYFDFNVQNTVQTHPIFHQIKALKLDSVNLEQGSVDEFISNCLPNLKSLNLVNTFTNLTGTVSIPNHHLSSLHIYLHPFTIRDSFQNVCVITQNKEPQFFTNNTHQLKAHSRLSNSLLPVTLDDLEAKH